MSYELRASSKPIEAEGRIALLKFAIPLKAPKTLARIKALFVLGDYQA